MNHAVDHELRHSLDVGTVRLRDQRFVVDYQYTDHRGASASRSGMRTTSMEPIAGSLVSVPPCRFTT